MFQIELFHFLHGLKAGRSRLRNQSEGLLNPLMILIPVPLKVSSTSWQIATAIGQRKSLAG
jgi:hypothetical protein